MNAYLLRCRWDVLCYGYSALDSVWFDEYMIIYEVSYQDRYDCFCSEGGMKHVYHIGII